MRARLKNDVSMPVPTPNEMRAARALLRVVTSEALSNEPTATENEGLTDAELVALSSLLIDYAISEWEGGRHRRNSVVACIAANLAFQVQRPGGKPVATIMGERLKSDPRIEPRMRAFLREVGQPEDTWGDKLDALARDGNYTTVFGLKGQNRISRSDCDNEFVPAFQRYLEGLPTISRKQLRRFLVAIPFCMSAFLAMCTNVAPAVASPVVAAKTSSFMVLKLVAAIIASIGSIAIMSRACGHNEPEQDHVGQVASEPPNRSGWTRQGHFPNDVFSGARKPSGIAPADAGLPGSSKSPVVDWRVISLSKGLDDGVTHSELLQKDAFLLEGRVTVDESTLSPTVTVEYFKFVFGGGFVQGLVGRCARESKLSGTLGLHLTIRQDRRPDSDLDLMRIVRIRPLLFPEGFQNLTDFGDCVYRNLGNAAFYPVQELGYWTVIVEFDLENNK